MVEKGCSFSPANPKTLIPSSFLGKFHAWFSWNDAVEQKIWFDGCLIMLVMLDFFFFELNPDVGFIRDLILDHILCDCFRIF